MHQKITFDKLPEAVAYLIQEVSQIRDSVEKLEKPPNMNQRHPIELDDACRLIMKAKPTVYALARKGLIPCYKTSKKLYFFEDELLDWIAQGKKKSLAETKAEIEAQMQKTVKHKPKNKHLL